MLWLLKVPIVFTRGMIFILVNCTSFIFQLLFNQKILQRNIVKAVRPCAAGCHQAIGLKDSEALRSRPVCLSA